MQLSIAFHLDSVEFTPAVIAGTASLGGSESACLGLARALAARGHSVYVFTTQLHADALAVDHAGVRWFRSQDIRDISKFVDWDVFVALRMPQVFDLKIKAGLRILWNQDLMGDDASKNQIMSRAWAYDVVAYVSEYHRAQWEGRIHELKPISWVTKNGFDPQHVPAHAVKNPNQIIHVTRPERGLRPLLTMWPELRRRNPHATLALCRYNSMYDATGWGKVCAQYDEAVKAVNAHVGGITYLGELGKPALYQAIAESAVMWYPGVTDFAETSCIAAIEAQACGTPFVGSWKGALPETVPHGTLIRGDADADPDYQEQSMTAVLLALENCARGAYVYREQQKRGREHVASGYSYGALAAEWEAFILGQFEERKRTHGPFILKRLLHGDDHVAAQALARELMSCVPDEPESAQLIVDCMRTADFCQYVMDGKDQVAEDYSARAVDPLLELKASSRIPLVAQHLKEATKILDVACGNGAFALAFAQANPQCHVTGVDYAQGNIDVATETAKLLGLEDRVTFLCAPAYDFAAHGPDPAFVQLLTAQGPFDGVFLGEFLEHIVNVQGLLEVVHGAMAPAGRLVATMPAGPFGELADKDMPIKKGHVHHFRPDDLKAIWGEQGDLAVEYMDGGLSLRGQGIGHWIVAYTPNGQPLGQRPIAKRILTTRPMLPLSIGILVHDTTDLRRCLTTVWPIADEIILANTGCDPHALEAVAAEWPRTRIIDVGSVHDLPGGFSEARNRTLDAATGVWFFWIDTDEQLIRNMELHTYLEGGIFNGYALKQNHLMLDSPRTFDTPVRVFKKQPSIQFYGCVHEQPQMGDSNGDILPALQLSDAEIAHHGYLTEDIRRKKCIQRNLPLVVRDQEQFPDRKLGKLLVLRDHLNLATWDLEAHNGKLSDYAKSRLQCVVGIFEEHFADPSNKHHAIARPFYEAALKYVAGSYEVEFSFIAHENGLKGRPVPERIWVRKREDIARVLANRVEKWTTPMRPPEVNCEPVVTPVVEPAGVPI